MKRIKEREITPIDGGEFQDFIGRKVDLLVICRNSGYKSEMISTGILSVFETGDYCVMLEVRQKDGYVSSVELSYDSISFSQGGMSSYEKDREVHLTD